MRPLVFLVPSALITACAPALRAPGPVVPVVRPTVVAYFPVTQAELDRNQDTSEAYSDFQFYASRMREPLEKAGIDFRVITEKSFTLKESETSREVRPKRAVVSYYLIAQGKQPRIQEGVMTDVDLFDLVQKYFGIIVK